eukprot:CAMPEP_0115575774 /NCGR_PEP_ID=MMETSP0272-20121206/2214_1 /TAXON_ID=71861 /ORGANISM="Scrippsiella trochoidea, Strain CCMP3099" /LENGTH=148 /DNA_ID=CAMNT_0003010533 /DNA_START=264 /DNA_END=711 /DNA_ORIENTATION=-
MMKYFEPCWDAMAKAVILGASPSAPDSASNWFLKTTEILTKDTIEAPRYRVSIDDHQLGLARVSLSPCERAQCQLHPPWLSTCPPVPTMVTPRGELLAAHDPPKRITKIHQMAQEAHCTVNLNDHKDCLWQCKQGVFDSRSTHRQEPY